MRARRSNAFVVMCRARGPLLSALLGLLAGCPASGDEVRPPADQFYFPTGMDQAPDGSVLFVASANSDLRYDSGSIQVVDLDRVDGLIDDWVDGFEPPSDRDCDPDLMVTTTLVCDEREVVVADGGIRIGNFASDLKVQRLSGAEIARVFMAVRGDPSLTWADYDISRQELSCGSPGAFPECDDEHRLTQLRNDPDLLLLPDEPFALFVDSELDSTGELAASGRGYVVMTHLSNGAVSLADAPTDGDAPILSDAVANLFTFDPNTGARGAVGVAGRTPGVRDDRLYVTSRVDSRVQTLIAVRPPPGADGRLYPSLVPTESFFMDRAVNTSTDGRGIAFGAGPPSPVLDEDGAPILDESGDPVVERRAGERAYIVNRAPPMLHIFDTSLDEQGVPRNLFLGGVELCSRASNLVVVTRPPGAGGAAGADRVYVACFGNGQVWVIDPVGRSVDAIIDVGRGPQALVASTERNRLYVSNNLEDTIAVIDITPGATTENRVVLRLGRPRSLGDRQ